MTLLCRIVGKASWWALGLVPASDVIPSPRSSRYLVYLGTKCNPTFLRCWWGSRWPGWVLAASMGSTIAATRLVGRDATDSFPLGCVDEATRTLLRNLANLILL